MSSVIVASYAAALSGGEARTYTRGGLPAIGPEGPAQDNSEHAGCGLYRTIFGCSVVAGTRSGTGAGVMGCPSFDPGKPYRVVPLRNFIGEARHA